MTTSIKGELLAVCALEHSGVCAHNAKKNRDQPWPQRSKCCYSSIWEGLKGHLQTIRNFSILHWDGLFTNREPSRQLQIFQDWAVQANSVQGPLMHRDIKKTPRATSCETSVSTLNIYVHDRTSEWLNKYGFQGRVTIEESFFAYKNQNKQTKRSMAMVCKI